MRSKAKQSKRLAKRPMKRPVGASGSARLYGTEKRRMDGPMGKRHTARRPPKTVRSTKEAVALATKLKRLAAVDLGVACEDMPITSDMSLADVESVLLLRALLKKYEDPASKVADELAIAEFLERNEACKTFQLEQNGLFDDIIDNEVKISIDRAIHPAWDSIFGLSQICEDFSVGPGASVGCEETDFLTKVFHSALTTTSRDLHEYYIHALGGSPWSKAEKARYSRYGLTLVEGSKLSTVPKNVDVSRVICTEPVLNMLFQKGIGKFLEGCLKTSFNIDLSDQPEINRELARQGSVDGSFCTIDLKGASDCISRRLCKELLPPDLDWWLELARSPVTSLPSGEQVQLEMISSMGNAYTFPLQTMIFASVVKAVYRVTGIASSTYVTKMIEKQVSGIMPDTSVSMPKVVPVKWGVFGDDIVVHRDVYHLVCRTLQRYGFTVNDGKSFNSGAFRESCGGDYWHGHSVRGVYVTSLKHDTDVLSVYNRLVRWSVRSGKFLDATLSFLKGLVRQKLAVPYTEGDTCGFKVPYSIAQKSTASSIKTQSALYRALRPKARSYAVPVDENDWVVKGGHRRNYNGDGILITFLGGFIRDGRVGLREKSDTAYKVRWVSIPYWDYIPKADVQSHRGRVWEDFAERYYNS